MLINFVFFSSMMISCNQKERELTRKLSLVKNISGQLFEFYENGQKGSNESLTDLIDFSIIGEEVKEEIDRDIAAGKFHVNWKNENSKFFIEWIEGDAKIICDRSFSVNLIRK